VEHLFEGKAVIICTALIRERHVAFFLLQKMVNELEIIKYDRTDEELEELILFLIAVAGKNAATTSRMIYQFLLPFPSLTPFEVVKLWSAEGEESFKNHLKTIGFGCQTRLAKAFEEIAKSKLNLRTCSRDDLLKIHGIGLKSANCFISWSRKGSKLAMLDTHLMKYIRNDLGHTDAPKSTPSSKKQYEKWEKVFLDHCADKKVDPTKYDLLIWKKYAKRPKNENISNGTS
jgi:thermostable 8-oxoguanine DNA glycosylase